MLKKMCKPCPSRFFTSRSNVSRQINCHHRIRSINVKNDLQTILQCEFLIINFERSFRCSLLS